MSSSELLFGVWNLVKMQILKSTLIIITLALLPVRNLWTIYLSVLIWVFIFYTGSGNLDFRKWVKTAGTIFLFFTIMYWSYKLFGLFGAVGLAIGGTVILLGMAGYMIVKNWKLYDAATTWGAERVRGVHKREFNLEEAMKK